MNPEQKINNVSEKIITNESAQEVVSGEVISEEEKQAKAEKKVQAEIKNNEDIAKIKEEIMNQLGGQESKEGYPEGHIMNPQMLDKIAQLEAISHDTFEIIQDRYEKYIKDEQEGRHGQNSVTFNQKNLGKLLEEDSDSKEDIFAFDSEVIYGEGGWNRYTIDATGAVKLNSGTSATNTTGSKQYFDALRSKAKELGMDI
jgi:hypothetical protein